MKHVIMAAKGENTPHDVAELTLMTLGEYRRIAPPGAPVPAQINHDVDGREISRFLGEHLPAETLAVVRTRLADDWLRNALEHIAGSCEGRAAEVARAALMGKKQEASTTAEKLDRIQGLLEQAHAVFVSMPTHVQDRITEIHNDEGSLIHCLNFGIQAAQEALERVNTCGDELDSLPRP